MTGNLASPLNFARFELPRLLPSLKRLLYLDPDVVVQALTLTLALALALALTLPYLDPDVVVQAPTLTLTLALYP